MKKFNATLAFQGVDLCGNRGLTDAQGARRSTEAALLGNGYEGFVTCEAHRSEINLKVLSMNCVQTNCEPVMLQQFDVSKMCVCKASQAGFSYIFTAQEFTIIISRNATVMWIYNNPVRIIAGPASLERIPDLVGNRKALFVTFPEAQALGLVQRVRALLGERLSDVISDIVPNPDIAWLAPLYDRLHAGEARFDCIVALGGGSVIDTAKVLMCATPSQTFDELLAVLKRGGTLPAGPHKGLIAVPTTAGTGSELTPWATVWDVQGGQKYSLHQPCTWAETALIDAELMQSLPAAPTLASGLDALSHALEAVWNIHRNPVSTALAVSAARSILQCLPRLMNNLNDSALRGRMAEASALAGLAFSNTKTALAHSLSYDITLRFGVAHGIACSFSLPHILDMALGADSTTDAALLSVFDAHTPAQARERLTAFLHALGVSTHASDYGIPDDQWDAMVQAAAQGPRGRNFIRAVPLPV